MVKVQLAILVLALSCCSTVAEARGHRMARQQAYTQYYAPAAPTMAVAAPSNVVVQTTNYAPPSNTVVQTSAVETSGSAVVQANSVVTTPSVITQGTPVVSQVVPQAAAAAPGSAQWKAEQSARIGSVQHLGGGFGGGSFEGNGFGPTPDQAIRNSCFWGQRTPIEIGVARGANGYYATIFYR